MVFPFGGPPPKKDSRRVIMDIVSTSSKEEMKKLLDYLVDVEGCHNIFSIIPDDHPHHSFHVDFYHKKDKEFSFVGLHVHAEQVYHGAKSFKDVDSFIEYRKNLALN